MHDDLLDPEAIEAWLARIRHARDHLGERARLGPPLAEAQVLAFERRWGVVLPTGFRRFVTELGNGGEGLGLHGWAPFDPEGATQNRPERWASPFVHPRVAEQREPPHLDAWGEEDEEARAHAVRCASERGWIRLGDHGCGVFTFLVITGEERGSVWLSDDRCRKSPLTPPGGQRDEARLSFLEHYGAWVEGLRR